MKTPSKKAITFLFVLTFVLINHNPVLSQVSTDIEATKVVGTVIASSPFSKLTLITGRTTSYFLDDILIRLEQDKGDLKKGQYLRFRYDHLDSKARLPNKMFKKQSQWEFALIRNEICDISFKKLLYYEIDGKTEMYLKQTAWGEKENFPLEAIIPCYILSAGGFKKL